MNAYHLTWRRRPPGLIDAAPLSPARLAAMAPDEVRAMPLSCGRRELPLGELFDVSPLPGRGMPHLRVEGAENLIRLGHRMQGGLLEIDGHGGSLVGAEMQSGEIRVRGAAGALAGAAMRGGLLVIEGDAGAMLGGPLPGGLTGMQGGELLVHGCAGPQAGLRQRRGLIAIAGTAGEYPGYNMLAGTLLVGQGELDRPGCRMVRGTIISLAGQPRPAATFGLDGPTRPVWLTLLWRRLTLLGFPLPPDIEASWFDSYTGDHLAGARGELLYRQPSPLRAPRPSPARAEEPPTVNHSPLSHRERAADGKSFSPLPSRERGRG